MSQSLLFVERLKALAGEDAARQLCDEFSGDLIQIRSITPPPIYIPKTQGINQSNAIKGARGANDVSEFFPLGAGSVLADGAAPVPFTVTSEHDLLASIETQLTKEVTDLTSSLVSFSSRVELIRNEMPASAHFSQAVAQLLSLFSLQVANALLKDSDTPLLVDDGAVYLEKLGLSLDELFREVDLDGRRFLAVALVDQRTGKVTDSSKAG